MAKTIKSVAQIAREALASTIAVQAVLCEGDDTFGLCFAVQSDFLESMHSSLLSTRLCRVIIVTTVTSTLLRDDRGGDRQHSWSSSIFSIACYRSSRVVPEPNDSAHAELSQVFGEVGGVEAPSDVKRWTRRTLPSAKINANIRRLLVDVN